MVKRYLIDRSGFITSPLNYRDSWELCDTNSFIITKDCYETGFMYGKEISNKIILSTDNYDLIDDYRKHEMLENIKRGLEFVSYMNDSKKPIIINLGSFNSYNLIEALEYIVELVDCKRINESEYIMYFLTDLFDLFRTSFGIEYRHINNIWERFDNAPFIYEYLCRYDYYSMKTSSWEYYD